MSFSSYQAPSPSRTGRKTLKFKRSVPVWSLDLEEALLQGLAEYRPSSARDPSLLQRFPCRNKWISKYIFERTGQTRTAKQVGSRIQQLRETCTDAEIIGLIVNKHFPPRSSSQHLSRESSLQSSSASPSPTSSTFPPILSPSPAHRETTKISVTLILYESDQYYGSLNPVITLDLDEQVFPEAAYPNGGSSSRILTIRCIGRISQASPEIKFSSKFLQGLNRRFRTVSSVYCGVELIYTECSVALEPLFDANSQSFLLHGQKLVPEFWPHMSCNPRDYSGYRIIQSIISTDMTELPYGEERALFSIEYSLEAGPIPVATEYEAQSLPPSMFDPFLPNYQYADFSSGYDYTLIPESTTTMDLTYPLTHIPNQAFDFHYSNL